MWTSAGTAVMIVLCCGVAPVAIIAGIGELRESSRNSEGPVVARASKHPSPPPASPQRLPAPPPPSASAASPSPESLELAPPLFEEPPAEQPLAEEPSVGEPYAQDPHFPQEPLTPQETAVPPYAVILPEPARPAQIGDVVRSGGLEFVVREVICGLKQLGTEARGQLAQGHFCTVRLSVRNIGQLTQNLLESWQKAIDTRGFQYSPSSTASLIANEPYNQDWLSGIDPGEEVSGFVVFDLPTDVNLAQVVLLGGVTVGTS